MLPLKELIPLGQILKILYGVDIDISQVPYLSFDLLDPFLHLGEVCQVFISKLQRTVICKLVFLPHIIDLFLRCLAVAALLAFQTEDFLVKL